MAKIDEMPEYRAKLPRHTHDLSHDFGFTCTTAHLLPVFHDYLNAGETIEVGFNYFLRTMPLQSAAMCTLKTHVEYFFVPMQLLYQPFGSFLYGITDEFSSNFSQSLMDQLPVVDLDNILSNFVETREARTLYTQNGHSIGENDVLMAYRLFDMFGFDPSGLVQGSVLNDHVNPAVFPYQFLAYNCIYEYVYRLDNRESFNNQLFNFDKYYTYADALQASDLPYYRNMFTVKYRPLDNDYFTDVKVSPIVDVLNMNNKNNLQVANQWLTRNQIMVDGTNGDVLSPGRVGTSFASPLNGVNPSSDVVSQFGFSARYNTYGSLPAINTLNGADISTANIRAMFASEKLWSITGRAKKHYDDQTLAHFGFKVPHDPKHEISRFGHDIGTISIGEVISTSNTFNSESGDGSPLAEIAGKGYGNMQNKSHKFTAPCHGVVMVIFSVVADRNYFEGIPKYNVMTDRSSLYQPEYDHLGMQPVFWYETQDAEYSFRSKIFGWQYRYEQWKRRYNRVTSAFVNRPLLGSESAPFYSWMNVSRQNLVEMENSANTNSYVNFVNLPSDINDLMLLGYNMTWQGTILTLSPYQTDPFVVASHINCKKISTMSDYSLPRLDA